MNISARCFRRWFLLLPASLITISASSPQGGRVDDAALRHPPDDEWITYGLNYAETRFSPLTQINPTNVSRLGLAWIADIGLGGGPQEATPLVSGAVLYAITNWSIVHTIDARTGKERWRFDPKVDRAINQGNTDRVCCAVSNRGVALYGGKLFIPVLDGRLVAVDVERGQRIWETQTTPCSIEFRRS